jgi:class 3 adenylate cyclase/tetratricopeptide (TPR) repeat protein
LYRHPRGNARPVVIIALSGIMRALPRELLPPPMNDLTPWLQSLGLGEHAPAFVAQGIDAELLPQLSDADLKELGVSLLGHRKRLLLAIAALALDAGGATATAPARLVREAERRQLTVMFCDLVGSTLLSGRLDPEDLQGLVRSYHDAVAAAVSAYDGHMAQLLGDGCLVYFGYPRAHEDDAERALHAALNVLKAVACLRPEGGIELQTRIGIATGQVVVGEIGAGTAAAEQTASGETPNLAARLQSQAAPGEIVVSAETRRLAGASFEFESTGAVQLKGFTAPVEAWRVRGERSVASRFEAQHESELIEFIGRSSEVSLLLERWAMARDGEGQVVLLTGEAGIGKSRICQTLRERLAGERHAVVLLQCSPYHSSSALHPLVQYLERTTGITPADTPELRGQKLERLMGPQMGLSRQSHGQLLRLMGAPDGGRLPPAGENPQQDKAQTLQAPIDLLRALARHLPVLMLIEDAHWTDPTTEQLCALTVEQSRDMRLLVLVTGRPEYTPPWGNPANLTRLALNRLGQRHCAELVDAVTGGRALPAEVLAEIIAKTDGVPLFVEELTKTVVQSGLLEDTPQGYRLRGPLPALAIPSTLQDSLMARLDRLAPAKEVAQVGAMIGREFSHRLLAAVLKMPGDKLAEALDELVRSELVARRGMAPDAVYTFRHALIRDTAYNSMLKSQRVLRHGHIAAAIAQTEPDTVTTQPELLAYHCQEGGQVAAAFGYWSAAGDLAVARTANREAVTHLRAALALLSALALEAQRCDEAELGLQMKLGNVLMQTEGFASAPTVASFSRARELAAKLGRIDQYVVACSGFGATLWAAGRFDEELAMLQQIGPDELASLQPMSRVFHSIVLGLVKFYLGALAEAHALAHDTLHELASVPPEQRQDISGVDPMVMALTQSVAICVHLGLLEQADAQTLQAMQIAQAREHAPTQAWVLSMARWMAFRHGDWAESIRLSNATLASSERMGFKTRLASGRLLLGRAVVASGQVDEGTRLLHEGYALWSAQGSQTGASELASIAADVLIEAGRTADAEIFVRAGEKAQIESPERFFASELARQRARLAQAAGDSASAEAGLRSAIEIAQAQGAKLFTLRAATDLARLLQTLGRPAEAEAVLRPALDALPEGLDQPDAMRAKATLSATARVSTSGLGDAE